MIDICSNLDEPRGYYAEWGKKSQSPKVTYYMISFTQHSRNCTIHGILQARILEWVAFPSPGDLPKPGIKPRSPALQADSLPAEPQGKPKNTGVGSLSLLQRIFLT